MAYTSSRNIVKEQDYLNFEIVSDREAYFIREDGTRLRRICGHIKRDGGTCMADAGMGTTHEGIGYCIYHDRKFDATKSWRKTCKDAANGSRLAEMIERAESGDILIHDLSDEIVMQRAFLLMYLEEVIGRETGEVDADGNPVQPYFSPTDLNILQNLNRDLIKSKETASRIKGSLRLDAITVRKFIDSILTFLVKELEDRLEKGEASRLVERMFEEVFAPMAAQGLISGDMTPLAQLPEDVRDLRLVRDNKSIDLIDKQIAKDRKRVTR